MHGYSEQFFETENWSTLRRFRQKILTPSERGKAKFSPKSEKSSYTRLRAHEEVATAEGHRLLTARCARVRAGALGCFDFFAALRRLRCWCSGCLFWGLAGHGRLPIKYEARFTDMDERYNMFRNDLIYKEALRLDCDVVHNFR